MTLERRPSARSSESDRLALKSLYRKAARVRPAAWITSIGLALAVLAVASIAAHQTRLREQRLLRAECERRTQSAAHALQLALDSAIVGVEALMSYGETVEQVGSDDFSAFVRPILQRHPSLRALGFNPIVRQSDRAEFEASLRTCYGVEHGIRQFGAEGLTPALARDEYTVVQFIEPIAGNQEAIGLDISSEPRRGDAIRRVRATREIATTAPLILAQEEFDGQYGFLVCGPVRDRQALAVDAGTAPIVALAVGVFRVDDVVSEAVQESTDLGIGFELFDGSELSQDRPIHRFVPLKTGSQPFSGQWSSSYGSEERFGFGGRDWVVRSWPTARVEAEYLTRSPLVILALGVGLAGLLVVYLLGLNAWNVRVRESEEKFVQLADNIRDVFWIADVTSSRVVYVSRAYEDVAGVPWDESLAASRPFLDRVHPDDRDEVLAATKRQLDGQSTSQVFRITRPGGEIRWLSDLASPVVDEHGVVFRIVGIVEDITESKNAEAQSEDYRRRLERRQKLEELGVLAGGVAHDFNNLLTVILGHVDLAVMKLESPNPGESLADALADDLEHIQLASERGADLTNQMLAYSGRGKFVVGPVDLSELISGMSRLLESTVTQRVRVEMDLTADLPEVRGDANQLQQLTLNLITNAAEACDGYDGEVKLSTGRVDATDHYLAGTYLDDQLPAGEYVYLEVADRGCGMDERTARHIFDPFFTTKFTGRGLGLASVIGIVRGHRGAIDLDTSPGLGTVIRVLFPALEARADSSAAIVVNEARLEGTATVLVVDDQPEIRSICRKALEARGLQVLTAENGREGLAVVQSSRIDAVLLDLTMPVMDGLEAFRELKRTHPQLPVILQSGYTESELEEKYGAEGFSDFLQKPFRLDALEAKLARVLRVRPKTEQQGERSSSNPTCLP